MTGDDRPGFGEACREWLRERYPEETAANIMKDVIEAGSILSLADIEALLDGDADMEELDQILVVYGPRMLLGVGAKVIGETYEQYLTRKGLN